MHDSSAGAFHAGAASTPPLPTSRAPGLAYAEVEQRTGNLSPRCPHTTRPQRREACSLCLGVVVERIVLSDDDLKALITVAPKVKTKVAQWPSASRGASWRERAKRQLREREARRALAKTTLITAPRIESE